MRANLILVVLATGFWYFSSSINAVASQKLFSGLKASALLQNRLEELNASTNQEATGIIFMAVILTVSQLFVGGIVSLAFLFFFGSDAETKKNRISLPQDQLPLVQQQQQQQQRASRFKIQNHVNFFRDIRGLDLQIGCLHCIGSICTNIGYGYGSASLVQVIKLLEPIETLLLTALVQQSLQALSFQKVASTLTIIGGTYMLLSNPSIEVNSKSVVFAVGSGICMVSRNVFSKSRQQKQQRNATIKEARDADNNTKSNDNHNNSFRVIFRKGMTKFATITIVSACSAVTIGLALAMANWQLFRLLIPRLMHFSHTILTQTIIFHCLYNMASITVLSLTSATSHSLLNVGKRIANVMIASTAFDIPLTMAGKIGLVVAAIGACFYNDRIAMVLFSYYWYAKVGGYFSSSKGLVAGVVVLCMVLLQVFQSMKILHSTEMWNEIATPLSHSSVGTAVISGNNTTGT